MSKATLKMFHLPAPGAAVVVGAEAYAEIREAVLAGDVKALELVPAHIMQTNVVDAARGQLVGPPMSVGLGKTGLTRAMTEVRYIAEDNDFALIILTEPAVRAATVGRDESPAGEDKLADRITSLLAGSPVSCILQSRYGGAA
jgi:hypothetical protein